MKKLAVAFLFCLTSSIANAQIGPDFRQIQKSVICGPFATIIKALAEQDIDEKPVWVGKDESEKTDYAVFVNSKSGAFTIVQFGKEIGCILGIGYKSQIFKLSPGNPT